MIEPIDDLESLQRRTNLSPLEQRLLATALFWKDACESEERRADDAESERDWLQDDVDNLRDEVEELRAQGDE